MSQIIKKGKYPEKNKITCEGCGCLFQYYNKEVVIDMTTPDEQSFLGGFGVHKYIRCPQCNEVCTISCEFQEDKDIFTEIKEWFCGRFKKSK